MKLEKTSWIKLIVLGLLLAMVGCVPESSDSTKIMGGREATAGEFPAVGRLVVVDDTGQHDNCTATLISPQHILTAAHCLQMMRLADIRFVLDGRAPMEFQAGQKHETYAEYDAAEVEQLMAMSEASAPIYFDLEDCIAKEAVSEECYDLVFSCAPASEGDGCLERRCQAAWDACENDPACKAFKFDRPTDQPAEVAGADVAVLALKTPVQDVTPLRLARTAPQAGTPIAVVGYGQTSLRVTETDGVKRVAENRLALVDEYSVYFTDQDPPNENGTLQGDSGGPIVVTVDGEQVVVGVIHGGNDKLLCERFQRIGTEGPRIDRLVGWIDGEMAGASETPSPSTSSEATHQPAQPAAAVEAPQADVFVTEDNSGQSVQLRVGQTLAVNLWESLSTGREWVFGQATESVLTYEGTRWVKNPAPPNTMGSGGQRYFVFRAAAAGSGSLSLNLEGPTYETERTYTLTVTVTQ